MSRRIKEFGMKPTVGDLVLGDSPSKGGMPLYIVKAVTWRRGELRLGNVLCSLELHGDLEMKCQYYKEVTFACAQMNFLIFMVTTNLPKC